MVPAVSSLKHTFGPHPRARRPPRQPGAARALAQPLLSLPAPWCPPTPLLRRGGSQLRHQLRAALSPHLPASASRWFPSSLTLSSVPSRCSLLPPSLRAVLAWISQRYRWPYLVAGLAMLGLAAAAWTFEAGATYWIWHRWGRDATRAGRPQAGQRSPTCCPAKHRWGPLGGPPGGI